jgi:hypothetical protein
MSRAEQAFAFCSALLGGPDGDDRLRGLYATLWTSGDKRTRWRRADEPGAVSSLVAELDEQASTRAVYICTTLTDAEPDDRCDGEHSREDGHDGPCVFRRPKAAESAGLVALWAEIDIAGEGHESANLPDSVEQAMRVVEAMRLAPTLVVHSGGGLHCWWVLTEPWLVRDADGDPGAERDKMAALERDWVAAARYYGDRLGRWKVDPVHDLARLLRPAGTTNRKQSGNPRPVKIVTYDPKVTYNPSDFEDALPDASVLTAYANPVAAGGRHFDEAQQAVLAEVNLAAVWARVISPAYKEADYLPEWLAEIIELEAEGADSPAEMRIGRTWRGERKDLKEDQNRYDAALMRLLADLDVDTEGLIEALMCRRLRYGAKLEKVNPKRRLDYVVRTVARFRAEADRVAAVQAATDQRMAAMASATLGAPDPRPEPVPRPHDENDPAAAEAAFTDFTDELIEHEPASEEEKTAAADAKVRAEANGGKDVPRPARGEVRIEDLGERSDLEAEQLDVLTELLIPEIYRNRGVQVWTIEYRDYGDAQRGRLMLRLPHDFDWPVQRPSRYRPGRLLPTEWWRRDMFDRPAGFQMALERDCLIISRDDGPKSDWAACIRALVPLWRKDSSGADLASYAHEWLFDYLMLHHGTGEPNEVGAQGRPWVKETRGWTPHDPPVIYVGRNEFLDHCRRQPGAVVGRAGAGVLEYLKLVKRRPRVHAPGLGARQTWYEIEPGEFSADEWFAIIEVTKHSYNTSAGKRGLHAVRPDGTAFNPDAGVGIDEQEAR